MDNNFWLSQQDMAKDEEIDVKEYQEEDLSEIERDYEEEKENAI